MKNFKCEHAYVHRRWLIKKYINLISINCNKPNNVQQFFSNEFKFIYVTLAPKIKANYYCWTYLNWIIDYLFQKNLIDLDLDILIKKIILDFERLLYINPGDFCLFHTRLNLIKMLTRLNRLQLFINKDLELKELSSEIFFQFVFQEYELFDDLLVRYSEYSSIWNYRKYFFFYILEFKPNQEMIQYEKNIDFDSMNNKLKTNFLNKYPNCIYLQNLNFDKNELNDTWINRIKEREFFISSIFENIVESDSKVKKYSFDFYKYLEMFVTGNTKILN